MIGYGFVSICLSEKDCSPAGNVTVKAVEGLEPQDRIGRCRRVARKNLTNTQRILFFCQAHDLKLYRLSSHLIPLVTHPYTDGWEWWEEFRPELERIGQTALETGLLLSTHPPEWAVPNSPDPEIFQWTKAYLAYHHKLFETMGIGPQGKIVFHVGRRMSVPEAIEALRANLKDIPPEQKARMVLENDDKNYTSQQTLEICQALSLPMVFDLHHHWCLTPQEDPLTIWPQVAGTWEDRPPKVHISSPKSEKQFRAHADYVQVQPILPFVSGASQLGDLDLMIEAKAKDLAALKLREDLNRVLNS